MAETVADFLLKRLNQWGIQRIYGCPGDGINGILGALSALAAAIGRSCRGVARCTTM
jgi:thiamine pyrophosphate-dependent acetolactate synthase large subunit-like protein